MDVEYPFRPFRDEVFGDFQQESGQDDKVGSELMEDIGQFPALSFIFSALVSTKASLRLQRTAVTR